MPRLSIVIPALGRVDAVEQSLASVLRNRPRDCEVVAAMNGPYADPYRLSGEVRFVPVPVAAGWAETVSSVLLAVRSPLVHLLGCGCEVPEGWTDGVLPLFDEPDVGAVAPVVRREGPLGPIASAGLAFTLGGRRKHLRLGACPAGGTVDGASMHGGFYRLAALKQLEPPVDPQMGPLADLDLGLRLADHGYRTLFAQDCEVFAPAIDAYDSAYRLGYAAQRLFARHGKAHWRARVAHLSGMLLDAACELPSPRALTRLVGNVVGALPAKPSKGSAATVPPAQPTAAKLPSGTRIDEAHPRSRQPGRTQPSPSQQAPSQQAPSQQAPSQQARPRSTPGQA